MGSSAARKEDSSAPQLLHLEPEAQLRQALQQLPPEQLDRLARLLREELHRRQAGLHPGQPGSRSRWARDPYMQWIHEHREELSRYPDHYVAIDPERGIVLAVHDLEDFGRQFSELVDREGCRGDKYLQTHTSLHA